ncbi:ADP-ribosyltransferase [Kitasatospora sp. NPDC005856]|uniref:ADP-ribosyltransferase n=1 Tax=Kitasatospora sp. NPDC005856 TaxID=3154566 RepID=UPI0033D3048E
MALTLIDSFTVDHPRPHEGTVRFLYGDLTQLAPDDAVDVLVVSCRPDDYTPAHGTLLEALSKAGISVEDLAKKKEADYREQLSCWISQPVTNTGVQFKRILVFEPKETGADTVASVWKIFQALACFSPTDPVRVAVPLVCAGACGAKAADVLSALTWAAAHHESLGTGTLCAVNIVALTEDLGKQLKPTFTGIKNDYANVFCLNLPDSKKPPYFYRTFVADAQTRVEKLRQAGQLPLSVTHRQALAVCIYTTNYYQAINSVLYRKNPTDPEYRQMFPLVEAIDSGLWNLKLHPGKVYRGATMEQSEIDKQTVGLTTTNKGYTSATKTASVAEGWPGNVKLTLDSESGVEVWNYSAYPDEDEVLFHRDFSYKLDKKEQESSSHLWRFTAHEILTKWCGGSDNA